VRDRESVDGYVRRIIANETTSLWRRPWRRREVVADVLPEQGRHDAYDDGRAAAVWRAVSSLPPRQRAVVVLRYYEELSEAETATILGVTVGTVKSQTSRALATLRARAPETLDRPASEKRDPS
jgi:RNA polymerase sigma factor (sigma-70 family)